MDPIYVCALGTITLSNPWYDKLIPWLHQISPLSMWYEFEIDASGHTQAGQLQCKLCSCQEWLAEMVANPKHPVAKNRKTKVKVEINMFTYCRKDAGETDY